MSQDFNQPNPYLAPQYKGQNHGQPAGNPLIVPAIFLIIFSSLSLIGGLFQLGFTILDLAGVIPIGGQVPDAAQAPAASQAEAVGRLAGSLAPLCTNGAIVAGANSMLRLKNHSSARLGAIIGMIPLCTGCLILGIPFAVWAFVLLIRPEVKRTFVN